MLNMQPTQRAVFSTMLECEYGCLCFWSARSCCCVGVFAPMGLHIYEILHSLAPSMGRRCLSFLFGLASRI